ncbi:hypothetical protein BT96DRAFT_945558 [Gymnopus androsaceus JB14]|uniref:Uncharacterized protein n=1 Tax=Gymnopus androsaceus JB14 TaxID=1447944 RepID=A0A6A4H0M3_9AGAR|nr:hypothetical protein BT96DRAFT_945558 [Gymnopus androsaceus JB14]
MHPWTTLEEFLSEAEVEKELALEDEQRLQERKRDPLHKTRAAKFMKYLLNIEENQEKLSKDMQVFKKSLQTTRQSSTLVDRRTMLTRCIKAVEELRAIYMPGLLQLLVDKKLPTSHNSNAIPEEGKIWFPSLLVCGSGWVGCPKCQPDPDPVLHPDPTCRVKACMLIFKNANVRGQRDSGRSREVIDGIHQRANGWAEHYCRNRSVLLALLGPGDWELELQPLHNGDVRSYTDVARKKGPGRQGTNEEDAEKSGEEPMDGILELPWLHFSHEQFSKVPGWKKGATGLGLQDIHAQIALKEEEEAQKAQQDAQEGIREEEELCCNRSIGNTEFVMVMLEAEEHQLSIVQAQYWQAWLAKLRLVGGNQEKLGWQELHEKDVHCMLDLEDAEHWKKCKHHWVKQLIPVLGMSGEEGENTEEEEEEYEEGEVGEGYWLVSWIWIESDNTNLATDQLLHAGLRVEWSKGYARVQQWEEEAEIIPEEMQSTMVHWRRRRNDGRKGQRSLNLRVRKGWIGHRKRREDIAIGGEVAQEELQDLFQVAGEAEGESEDDDEWKDEKGDTRRKGNEGQEKEREEEEEEEEDDYDLEELANAGKYSANLDI